MAEEIRAGITAERVEVRLEDIFRPEAVVVEVVLQPQFEPYEPLPEEGAFKTALATPLTKSIVLNIETTGLMPFDSRITHIAAIDIEKPGAILSWFDEDEKKMLQDFVTWFETNEFNEIIGYGVSFDYRFIFTKAMRYGIQTPAFFDASLWDVAQSMKQVKQAFVFGFNKVGTLDEWAFYMFGLQPPITQKEAIQAFVDKEYDKIADYNRYKVNASMLLWALIKITTGEMLAKL